MPKRSIEKLRICNLVDCPEYLSTIAKRYRKTFFKDSVDDLSNTRYCIQHACYKNKIPQTLIAFLGNIPVATASIWNCDIAFRQDLSPRLANLYVEPKYRKLGIGSKLQDEVIKKVQKLWYKKIYLYTKLEWYYEKNGWKFKELIPVDKHVFERLYLHSL